MVISIHNKMRIYLDVCCLNRLFDDPSQARIRMEAEAVKTVLLNVGIGEWMGIGSEAIDYEVRNITDPDLKNELLAMLEDMAEYVRAGEGEFRRAAELQGYGLKSLDALHAACAEAGNADVLLTTDDQFLKKATINRDALKVRIANPLIWLGEVVEK